MSHLVDHLYVTQHEAALYDVPVEEGVYERLLRHAIERDDAELEQALAVMEWQQDEEEESFIAADSEEEADEAEEDDDEDAEDVVTNYFELLENLRQAPGPEINDMMQVAGGGGGGGPNAGVNQGVILFHVLHNIEQLGNALADVANNNVAAEEVVELQATQVEEALSALVEAVSASASQTTTLPLLDVTSSDVDGEGDDEENAVGTRYDWSCLPDVAKLLIFESLADRDRLALATTCRAMHAVFSHPTLWRERTFRFDSFSRHIFASGSPAAEQTACLGFARCLGQHVRRLNVYLGPHPTLGTCKRFQKTMRQFFEALRTLRAGCPKLQELAMPGLQVERFWRFSTVRVQLARILTPFLHRQRALRRFNMTRAMLPAAQGLALLRALARGAGRTLTHLLLEDFFAGREHVYNMAGFSATLGRFRQLTSLHFNYSFMSDEVLDTLAAAGPQLRFLRFKVRRRDPHHHRLSAHCWRDVARRCPLLRAHMSIEGLGDWGVLSTLLVHHIPLTRLSLWTSVPGPDDNWRYDETLLAVASKYAGTLEELLLSVENTRHVEPIDDALLALLAACSKLDDLDVQGFVRPSTVQRIYELQSEDKLQLQRCCICMEGLTAEEMDEVEELNDQYMDMVAGRCLDFEIGPSQDEDEMFG